MDGGRAGPGPVLICDIGRRHAAPGGIRRNGGGAAGEFAVHDRNDREPVLEQARWELEEYAGGKRTRFEVPFELEGTHFQCEVWKALFEIPFGEVRTYGELARALGRPGAARAAGAPAAKNPLPVIIACHRLVGAGGALTGFSGGLDVKRRLLELERPVRGSG